MCGMESLSPWRERSKGGYVVTGRNCDALWVGLLAQLSKSVYYGTATADAWPELRTAIELRGGDYLALPTDQPGGDSVWHFAATACPLCSSQDCQRSNGSRELHWVGPGVALKLLAPATAALVWCYLLNNNPAARLEKSEAWAALSAHVAVVAGV
jgi:hypothetical protein